MTFSADFLRDIDDINGPDLHAQGMRAPSQFTPTGTQTDHTEFLASQFIV